MRTAHALRKLHGLDMSTALVIAWAMEKAEVAKREAAKAAA